MQFIKGFSCFIYTIILTLIFIPFTFIYLYFFKKNEQSNIENISIIEKENSLFNITIFSNHRRYAFENQKVSRTSILESKSISINEFDTIETDNNLILKQPFKDRVIILFIYTLENLYNSKYIPITAPILRF